jgi:acyl-CoA thioester hydrolase
VGHVRHTVYYDLCATQRTEALARLGIDMAGMQAAGLAPVLFKESCAFKRELHFGDRVRIEFVLLGMRDRGSRFAFRHRFLRADEVCAELEVEGAWIDLRTRRLGSIPEDWAAKFEQIERSPDFRTL